MLQFDTDEAHKQIKREGECRKTRQHFKIKQELAANQIKGSTQEESLTVN